MVLLSLFGIHVISYAQIVVVLFLVIVSFLCIIILYRSKVKEINRLKDRSCDATVSAVKKKLPVDESRDSLGFTRCRACDKQIEQTLKFCPYCGSSNAI